jgi:hypothetical protein
MESKKNQHLIPRFYLNKFADSKKKISVYNIKEKIFLPKQSTRKCSVQRYFYNADPDMIKGIIFYNMLHYNKNIDIDSIYKLSEAFIDEQHLENHLSSVESDVAQIFDEIERNPLTIQDARTKALIASFLYDLSMRTEAVRNIYSHFYDEENNALAEASNECSDSQPQENKNKHEIIKNLQLSAMFAQTERNEKLFKLYANWSFSIGSNKTETGFILSDNPAMGIFMELPDICIPITPRKALMLKARKLNNENNPNYSFVNNTIELSREDVLEYNHHQLEFACRYAYGDYNFLRSTIDTPHKKLFNSDFYKA